MKKEICKIARLLAAAAFAGFLFGCGDKVVTIDKVDNQDGSLWKKKLGNARDGFYWSVGFYADPKEFAGGDVEKLAKMRFKLVIPKEIEGIPVKVVTIRGYKMSTPKSKGIGRDASQKEIDKKLASKSKKEVLEALLSGQLTFDQRPRNGDFYPSVIDAPLKIPEGVEKLEIEACCVQSIKLPSTLKSLEIENCPTLLACNFPKSLESVEMRSSGASLFIWDDDMVFTPAFALESLEGASATRLGIAESPYLTKLVLGEGWKFLFLEEGRNLYDVRFPNLETLVLPASLEFLGGSIAAPKLQSIVIAENSRLRRWEARIIGAKAKTLTFPSVYFPYGAKFEDCPNLISVRIKKPGGAYSGVFPSHTKVETY